MKTQRIKIDFSSRGIKRGRLFTAKAYLAAFIAAALTLYNTAVYLKCRAELGRKMREAEAIEENLAALQRGPGLKDAAYPARSLYWTTLLTRLEERLPDRAIISGLKAASKDNRVFIAGGAEAMDKALLFVENLEKDNGFEGVVLTSRASLYNGNLGPAGRAWEEGAVGFSIEAIYRPEAGR
ncbi:MAG: PilN domain-containing protein [Deltaproteobacteria bacterium]|nr:PilN domain-containing protein [Deltaproteobacteria bacterium]